MAGQGNLRVLIWLAAVAIFFSSCTRRIYIPVEQVRTERVHDSTLESRLRVDTIFARDCVVIRQAGDTLYHATYRERYKVRMKADTVYLERRDTVIQQQRETVPIETKSSGKWKGVALWAAALLMAVLAIGDILLRRRSH